MLNVLYSQSQGVASGQASQPASQPAVSASRAARASFQPSLAGCWLAGCWLQLAGWLLAEHQRPDPLLVMAADGHPERTSRLQRVQRGPLSPPMRSSSIYAAV